MPPHWNHVPVVEVRALKEWLYLGAIGYAWWRVRRMMKPPRRK